MTLTDHTDPLKGKVHVNVHIGACIKEKDSIVLSS